MRAISDDRNPLVWSNIHICLCSRQCLRTWRYICVDIMPKAKISGRAVEAKTCCHLHDLSAADKTGESYASKHMCTSKLHQSLTTDLDWMKMLPRTTNLTLPARPTNLPSLMVTISATLMLLPLASGAVILRFSGNFLLMSGRRQTLTLGLSAVPCKSAELSIQATEIGISCYAVAHISSIG